MNLGPPVKTLLYATDKGGCSTPAVGMSSISIETVYALILLPVTIGVRRILSWEHQAKKFLTG
jgi:hypothetical protein